MTILFIHLYSDNNNEVVITKTNIMKQTFYDFAISFVFMAIILTTTILISLI